MAIEFACHQCGKVLKTDEAKAGLTARCPDCGATVTVPQADSAPESAAEEDAAGGDLRPCPMCGREIRQSARVCRYCGERLDETAGIQPTPVQPGEVINKSFALFKAQGVPTTLALLITGGIQAVLIIGVYVAVIAILLSNGFPRRVDEEAIALVVLVAVPVMVILFFLGVFLNLGLSLFMLNVAKGRNPNLGDVFAGGKYYASGLLLMFLTSLVMMLIYLVAYSPMLLLFAMGERNPGMINLASLFGNGLSYLGVGYFQMRFLPAMYHLVDRQAGAVDSLKASWAFTAPNQLTQFVVVPIMMIACQIVGMVLCCVGIFPAFAFFMLMQAGAYLMMTGRSIAEVE